MDKQQLAKIIGNNIKSFRKTEKINQAELARRCFKDKQAIEKIENGKVNATIHSLYIIAVAMNKELSDLVVIKPNP
jgi:transcriptional regulator with XRE-family HTH domain